IRPDGVESAPHKLHPLAESAHYLLGHERETVLLIEKASGSRTAVGNHFGDPQAGVVTPDEAWFVSGGEGVLCHRLNGELLTFFRAGHPPFLPGQSPVGQPAKTADDESLRFYVHGLRLDGRGNV